MIDDKNLSRLVKQSIQEMNNKVKESGDSS